MEDELLSQSPQLNPTNFQDIPIELNKLENQKFIRQLYAVLNQIYSIEHQWTVSGWRVLFLQH